MQDAIERQRVQCGVIDRACAAVGGGARVLLILILILILARPLGVSLGARYLDRGESAVHVHEVFLLPALRRLAHGPRREQRRVVPPNLPSPFAVPVLLTHRVWHEAAARFASGVLVQVAELIDVRVHVLRKSRAPHLRRHSLEVLRERVPPRLAHERALEERVVVESAEDQIQHPGGEVLEADVGCGR